jgi:hypothetical protein
VKGSQLQSSHKSSINYARFAFVSLGVFLAINTVLRFAALSRFTTLRGKEE